MLRRYYFLTCLKLIDFVNLRRRFSKVVDVSEDLRTVNRRHTEHLLLLLIAIGIVLLFILLDLNIICIGTVIIIVLFS